jgi:hypothetical protein
VPTQEALGFNRNAAHEAGHVLACIEYKVPFRYATLRPRDARSEAHVVLGSSSRCPAEDLMRVLVAGPVAESWLVDAQPGIDHEYAFCDDLDGLIDLSKQFGRGARGRDARSLAIDDAVSLMEARSFHLFAIADELFKRKTLSATAVRELIDRIDHAGLPAQIDPA